MKDWPNTIKSNHIKWNKIIESKWIWYDVDQVGDAVGKIDERLRRNNGRLNDGGHSTLVAE